MKYNISTTVRPVEEVTGISYQDIIKKALKGGASELCVLDTLDVIKATFKFPGGCYVVWSENTNNLEDFIDNLIDDRDLDPNLCSLDLVRGPLCQFGLNKNTRDWVIYRAAIGQLYFDVLDDNSLGHFLAFKKRKVRV
jgi:hypothetical protein